MVVPLRIAMASYYLPSDSKIVVGYVAHRLAQVLVRRGHHLTMFSFDSEAVAESYAALYQDMQQPK